MRSFSSIRTDAESFNLFAWPPSGNSPLNRQLRLIGGVIRHSTVRPEQGHWPHENWPKARWLQAERRYSNEFGRITTLLGIS
jgi:hypothetical protein